MVKLSKRVGVIVILTSLLLTYIGVTIISSVLMGSIINFHNQNPAIFWVGVVSLIVGLVAMYYVSRDAFKQITQIAKLLQLMKGQP